MKKIEITFDNGIVKVIGDADLDGKPSFELQINSLESLTELWDIINSVGNK